MGDDPKTKRTIDLSPGMAKVLEVDCSENQEFWEWAKGAFEKGISISGSIPMYVRREVNTENDGDDIFEVEYQVGDKPSVKISGTLEEIRTQLTKTD